MSATITAMKAEIRDIDRGVAAIHRKLCRLERVDKFDAASWQRAWAMNPLLHEDERQLFQRRGRLQSYIATAEYEAKWITRKRKARVA